MANHNIICLEAEWLYNDKDYKFNLKSEPLLHCLREYHGSEVIYCKITNKF